MADASRKVENVQKINEGQDTEDIEPEKKKGRPKKDRGPTTSGEIAKKAGVSEALVNQKKWCETWIPEIYNAGIAGGLKIGTLYKIGHDMKKLIAKHGMWKEVKNNELIAAVSARLGSPHMHAKAVMLRKSRQSFASAFH